MEKLYEKYKDRAQFFLIYIREAHPADGWQVPINEKEGIIFSQPGTKEERREIASACVRHLGLSMPTLIDDMKNTVGRSYNAWPDRIFIVGLDGRILYRSDAGPKGFKVDELERELQKLFY